METENKDVQVTEEEKVEETTEKTYTQEDLDNSFNAGRKKASHDWQKDEKYKEFMEWKKTSQNDSEKLIELETTNAQQGKKIQELEALLKIKDSDVKKEFQKFVSTEVANMVNEDTDFDTALKKYKTDNPQYFGEVVVKKVQSSPTLNGGSKPSTVNDIFNNMIRSA